MLLTRQLAGRYMAIARFRASRDRPGPAVPKGGDRGWGDHWPGDREGASDLGV